MSIHLLLPHLSTKVKLLMELVAKLDVDIKRVPNNPGMFQITNKIRMGITEIDSVVSMEQAALSLIGLEESVT